MCLSGNPSPAEFLALGIRSLQEAGGEAVPACLPLLLLQDGSHQAHLQWQHTSDLSPVTPHCLILFLFPVPSAGAHNRESHVAPSREAPLTPKPLPA